MRLLTGFRDYIATCLLPTRGELVCVSNASDTWKKTKKKPAVLRSLARSSKGGNNSRYNAGVLYATSSRDVCTVSSSTEDEGKKMSRTGLSSCCRSGSSAVWSSHGKIKSFAHLPRRAGSACARDVYLSWCSRTLRTIYIMQPHCRA